MSLQWIMPPKKPKCSTAYCGNEAAASLNRRGRLRNGQQGDKWFNYCEPCMGHYGRTIEDGCIVFRYTVDVLGDERQVTTTEWAPAGDGEVS